MPSTVVGVVVAERETRIGHGDAAGEVDDKISKDMWYIAWWAEAAAPQQHARTHVHPRYWDDSGTL